jgi:hypothetical protein
MSCRFEPIKGGFASEKIIRLRIVLWVATGPGEEQEENDQNKRGGAPPDYPDRVTDKRDNSGDHKDPKKDQGCTARKVSPKVHYYEIYSGRKTLSTPGKSPNSARPDFNFSRKTKAAHRPVRVQCAARLLARLYLRRHPHVLYRLVYPFALCLTPARHKERDALFR